MLADWLATIADRIWSYPVVGLCLLGALFFSARLGFIQLRAVPHTIALLRGRYDRAHEAGQLTHFQALSAALSGTIGIGNIGGVAIAISTGGPGAVLWMWAFGVLAMATKFAECTLATHYRALDPETGAARGGPMYYIAAALGPRWRPLALFYAGTMSLCAFGFTCMFQSNQAASALLEGPGVPTWVSGLGLVLLGGLTVMGGIKRIGALAARLVPGMCLLYLGAALLICILRLDQLDDVLWVILQDGLSGDAMFGGALGSVIMAGVRRAVFSNEAGLGSAGIAHAAVKTDEPVREGLVASLGPFIDTVVVSSATAFIIVLAQLDGGAIAPGLKGIALTAAAFERDLPGFGSVVIPVVGFLFAFSTMVTWSFYGETATAYVIGARGVKPYRVVFVALAFVGATQELGVVISFSDAMVGLLVIPNMLALLLLSGSVADWTRDYFHRLARGDFELA